MKRDPQIFRKCEMVLLYFTDDKWYKNIPKMWRFTLYPAILNCIIEMMTASADAFDFQENRISNIVRIMSSLRKVRAMTRVFKERRIISAKQSEYLSGIYDDIENQATKWKKSQGHPSKPE